MMKNFRNKNVLCYLWENKNKKLKDNILNTHREKVKRLIKVLASKSCHQKRVLKISVFKLINDSYLKNANATDNQLIYLYQQLYKDMLWNFLFESKKKGKLENLVFMSSCYCSDSEVPWEWFSLLRRDFEGVIDTEDILVWFLEVYPVQ